jgi:hypothetical protein
MEVSNEEDIPILGTGKHTFELVGTIYDLIKQ